MNLFVVSHRNNFYSLFVEQLLNAILERTLKTNMLRFVVKDLWPYSGTHLLMI